MSFIFNRSDQCVFVLLCQVKAREVHHKQTQVVFLCQTLAYLYYVLHYVGVIDLLSLGVKSRDDLLLQSDQLVQIMPGEFCNALVDQLHMHVVPLHHLLILRHGSDHLSHLSQ